MQFFPNDIERAARWAASHDCSEERLQKALGMAATFAQDAQREVDEAVSIIGDASCELDNMRDVLDNAINAVSSYLDSRHYIVNELVQGLKHPNKDRRPFEAKERKPSVVREIPPSGESYLEGDWKEQAVAAPSPPPPPRPAPAQVFIDRRPGETEMEWAKRIEAEEIAAFKARSKR